jgi:hypothetical protein
LSLTLRGEAFRRFNMQEEKKGRREGESLEMRSSFKKTRRKRSELIYSLRTGIKKVEQTNKALTGGENNVQRGDIDLVKNARLSLDRSVFVRGGDQQSKLDLCPGM